ncbi:MAG: FAD-dependent oxidoreductase [Candidatus Eremiobacteraeota bacterium]|nr:FAD-dependent oxidoreductase [Candidatus Eremiobacteraeota bacterium]
MSCEVAIVGAGPAGSSCAFRLARAGYAVTVVERSTFPRTKVCGEYLSAASLAQLLELGVGPKVEACAENLRRIRLHTRGVQVDLPFGALAWSVARADLDALLLAHAIAAGAVCLSGRVEQVDRTSDGFVLSVRDGAGFTKALRARVVVGADGIGSIVARDLGLASPVRRAGRFALGGHYAGFGNLEGTIEMYVRGRSYFAINPLGHDVANVMVIVEEKMLHEWSGAIDERLREAARELGAGRRSVDDVRLLGKRVAVGPLSQRTRVAAERDAYLIGDAAGFLDPFTGQGVFLALKSASLAAEAIQSPSADASATYSKHHRHLFAGRARIAGFVSALIKTPGLAPFAAYNLQRNARLRDQLMHAVTGAP